MKTTALLLTVAVLTAAELLDFWATWCHGEVAAVHAGLPKGGKAEFEREIERLLSEPRR